MVKNNDNHYCYILKNSYENDINRTYNGYTNNPKHRIRQHNQEIKGGAIYTKKYGNRSWEIYLLIKGFPDKYNALQCEWKIKKPTGHKKRPIKYNSPAGRIKGLNEIIKMQKWTANSTIDIKDINLELWILKEYAHLLTNIPNNIQINIVDYINLDNI